MRNRPFAICLALILGGLGIQHFYLGNIGLGILCMLFCWTGIPFILAFIHALMLLSMSERKFHEKYGDKYEADI
jgi:TM2 domain-containing membrane protein YozV